MDEPIFDLTLVEIYDERWILAGEGGNVLSCRRR